MRTGERVIANTPTTVAARIATLGRRRSARSAPPADGTWLSAADSDPITTSYHRRPMDAREWLGLEPTHNPNRWILPVTPGISTPGNFLFGGCGLGAAISALEGTTGRPLIWATAQYLSYAKPPSIVDIDVRVAAEALVREEGGITLESFGLSGGQLAVTGTAETATDNFLRQLQFDATVADPAGGVVTLPLPGEPTRVQQARLAVDFGAEPNTQASRERAPVTGLSPTMTICGSARNTEITLVSVRREPASPASSIPAPCGTPSPAPRWARPRSWRWWAWSSRSARAPRWTTKSCTASTTFSRTSPSRKRCTPTSSVWVACIMKTRNGLSPRS